MPLQPPSGSLQKAYLRMVKPSYDGASGLGSKLDEVEFMFNPKEYSISKSATWTAARVVDKAVTMPQFGGGGPAKLKVEVFLDATEPTRRPASLRAALTKLFDCCGPLMDTVTKNVPSPPFVIFGWGTTMSFPAILTAVTVKYTMFRPDGTPVRASATLTLEEIPSNKKFQNPTSGALDSPRTHTVVDGDSLASIAYSEYGAPNDWRTVAEANGIDDPMRLPAGSRLLVPSTDTPSAN